jgi:DNA-binding CsgD family transcriptional regulator
MARVSARLLEIIEAIYRDESDERAWIGGILAAATPVLDRGCGLVGFPFEIGEQGLRAPWAKVVHAPPEIQPAMFTAMLKMARNDAGVQSAFRGAPCETSSQLGFGDHPAWKPLIARGILDFIAVCGIDTAGHGVVMGPLLPRVSQIDAPFRERFARVAAHLGVGQRYRRQRNEAPAQAVFSPGAKLLHAEGDARKRAAREALARAVVTIDRARGRQRRTDPDGALHAWKGLVDARWSLVDEFESDGKRYVVARENEPVAPSLAALSKRERQIVGYAVLGHTSKLIAYELGIADATVRVLLHRAKRKLKVKLREGLVEAFVEATRSKRGRSKPSAGRTPS